MYQLYYKPGACSMAVHAFLNELGVKFEPILADDATRAGEDFRKLNPRGAVPVLVEDGFAICEGAAILTYLADKHNYTSGWSQPSDHHGRAHCLQTLMFLNATLHPHYSKAFWTMKTLTEESPAKAALLESARQNIQSCWDQLNQQLASQDYLCGTFGPTDILMSVFANWQGYLPFEIKYGSNVQRVINSVSSRPSFQSALSKEQVTYKAAA